MAATLVSLLDRIQRMDIGMNSNILMRVHNGSKIDLPIFDLRVQYRCNPDYVSLAFLTRELANLLWRIGRVNDHGFLRRLICHQVGIIIALPGP